MIIYKCDRCNVSWQKGIIKKDHDKVCEPEPVLWIPANASARNPIYWDVPDSLCRTCTYQFLGEPFCKTVDRQGEHGTTGCSGHKKETKIDENSSLPSYTVND